MTFSFYERSNSMGESSRTASTSNQSNGTNSDELHEHVRGLNFNDRASPQPMRYSQTNQIMKSRSGHSFKDFNSKWVREPHMIRFESETRSWRNLCFHFFSRLQAFFQWQSGWMGTGYEAEWTGRSQSRRKKIFNNICLFQPFFLYIR